MIKKWLGLEFYVSKLDQFLKAFNKNHSELSASQLAEKARHNRVVLLRDNDITPEEKSIFWDKF